MKIQTKAKKLVVTTSITIAASLQSDCTVHAFLAATSWNKSNFKCPSHGVMPCNRHVLTMKQDNMNIETLSSEINDNNSIRPVRPITQRTRFQGALALLAITTASNNGLQFQAIPIGESLLALVASVVFVSGATDAIERITSSDIHSIPPYNVAGERYDQSKFLGRYCKMILACDPRLLLYTEEEVRQYYQLAYVDCPTIVQSSDATTNHETDRLLWKAKRIADSALHPETLEWIPRPFRMSGYLPFNGPICVAMIAVSSTAPLLFWSWMNQSQNALVNYFNGPKNTVDTDKEDAIDATLIKSYVLAVTSALVVAFGLATYIQNNYSGQEATTLLRFISFPSAVIASSLNCYIVRSPEIDTGVPLMNERMENVLPGETSIVAARRGVYSTTSSRAILQMPTYFIPPLILDTVTPLKVYLAENPLMVVPVTTFLLLVSFGIGLPCAVGLFPQISSIEVEEVEEPFRELGYDRFYYNKGL